MGSIQVMCPPGVRIIDHLRKKNINMPAPCGGAGVCGKCVFRLRGGFLPVTDADRSFLSSEQLEAGFRLACRAVPPGPVRIEIPESAGEDFQILSADNDPNSVLHEKRKSAGQNTDFLSPYHSYAVAIDIGTTTVAAALVDTDEKKTVCQASRVNSQRTLGFDVVARQEAAINGRGEALKRLIVNDMISLISEITSGNNDVRIDYICIAANTTMQHLLMEYDCSGIASWPFTPVSLGEKGLTVDQVFGGEKEKLSCLAEKCYVDLIPGVSAYVGGDVTAGMLEYGFHMSKDIGLLIDIGTNAEMALLHDGMITVASAAAGPAFEGGNLKCGTGSVPGAISGVYADVNVPDGFRVTTIADAPPSGICGTGAIEAVAAFLDAGIIDEHGTFVPDLIEKGFIFGTDISGNDIFLDQDDIRQVQMAKGAVRSGVEALLKVSGVDFKDIGKVILAGGFGTFIKPEKAVRIGMLPAGAEKKCIAAGNTALKGAVRVCMERTRDQENPAYTDIEAIICKARQFELAEDEYFKERYIEYMEFKSGE